MRPVTLLVALLLAACSNPPTSQPTPTPTPVPTAAPLPIGVFTRFGADAAGHYAVQVVGIEGRVLASYLPSVGGDEIPPALTFQKCCAVFLPTLSLSGTRVYFPDGDGKLRALSPDGSTSIVHDLPNVRGHSRAVFAVSPDDRSIAVSVFDWSLTPMALRIYVEDLNGGGHHVEIFSSSSAYEWPVGWHLGNLVLAVNPVPNASNPYGAGAYHVASASDGTRLATLGGPECPVVGPLSPAGTACASSCDSTTTCVEAVNWSGIRSVVYRRDNGKGSGASWSALSPDGRSVTTGTGLGDGVATTSGVTLFPGRGEDFRHWWIDDAHVLGQQCVGADPASCTNMWAVIDVGSGSAIGIDSPDWVPVGWFPVRA